MCDRPKDQARIDYGDWQTDFEFAKSVCHRLKAAGVHPEVLIEPTCGVGNFIAAAIEVFGSVRWIYAIDICREYVDMTEGKLHDAVLQGRIESYEVRHANIFTFDFREIIKRNRGRNILVLGNPPWVTNSGQGKTGGANLPDKGNIKNVRGIDAITGKGNFDIAENVCYRVMDAFAEERDTCIALLIKNSVVKNIVHRQRLQPRRIAEIKQMEFDAKKEFDVSVAASLFCCRVSDRAERICEVSDYYTGERVRSFGWVDDAFTANIDEYNATRVLDGTSQLVWRSGIKHDCSKVMELRWQNGQYINGFGEVVDVEPDKIYPLLKSSDIGNGYRGVRRYLILPQTHISEDTEYLKSCYPKTYSYLNAHADLLDGRKSVIYRNKPRFSVFGLGAYSFAPYKVVVSSLYRDLNFSLVSPIDRNPVMLDDTCYQLGFDNPVYARITLHLLQSPLARQFLRNISFTDAKRIVSRELLMRINLYKLAMAIKLPDDLDVAETDEQGYREWLLTKEVPSLF